MKKLIKRILRPFAGKPFEYEQLIHPAPRNVTKKMILSILRKNLVVTFMLLSSICFSQAHFDIGGGIGTLNQKVSGKDNTQGFGIITPVMRLGGGYTFINNIVTDAIIQASTTRKVNSPCFFGLKAGYNLNGFIPSVGYLYDYCNADDVSQNKWGISYSLKYVTQLNDNGGLFVETLYSQKCVQLTFGFHIVFNND